MFIMLLSCFLCGLIVCYLNCCLLYMCLNLVMVLCFAFCLLVCLYVWFVCDLALVGVVLKNAWLL